MFEGKKTYVFWLGLIILAIASTSLFGIIWFSTVMALQAYSYSIWPSLQVQVPFIVAATVFILIGYYMMKSGTQESEEQEPPSKQS